VRRRFEAARDAARRGERQRVLFLVPPNNKCSGPLYEIVFMLETWLRRQEARDPVEITWSTYEHGFIQAFGPRLHELVCDEFAARGIDGHTDEVVTEVREREVSYADGSTRGYDHLVAFPPYVAGVRYPALPSDERGYIAADVTGAAFRQPFDSVSMCIMEMFDKATFAQVPVEVTGDDARAVRVRPDADGDYRVGTSPVWRLGKKVLGYSVPMRFGAGDPFHAGRMWQAMDLGIRAMSGVLAR
jgi:hypothetical protein